MNPDQVAKFDQAGAGFRQCSEMLVQMAQPFIQIGLGIPEAIAVALELMQTVLMHSDAVALAAVDDADD